MQRFTPILLIMVLAVAGCADPAPPVSPATKAALLKVLDAKFVLTSVPKEREEEFYHVLEAFAVGRMSDEFVRRVDFTSANQAELSFSNSGWHGGGTVSLKKKGGRWILGQKWYFT